MGRAGRVATYIIIGVLVFAGAALDVVDAYGGMTLEVWQDWYAVTAELQLIGFALLAFTVCPYRRVEIKAASFFMVLWRVAVAVINMVSMPVIYSPVFLGAAMCIYVVWLARAFMMGRYKDEPEKPGAYYFYMPIHSVWGLLKSLLPWEMARYESVFVVEGGTMWAVNHERFVVRRVSSTDIETRRGVRVYLGRAFTSGERLFLNSMVDKRAIPGIRDCRKLKVA